MIVKFNVFIFLVIIFCFFAITGAIFTWRRQYLYVKYCKKNNITPLFNPLKFILIQRGTQEKNEEEEIILNKIKFSDKVSICSIVLGGLILLLIMQISKVID